MISKEPIHQTPKRVGFKEILVAAKRGGEPGRLARKNGNKSIRLIVKIHPNKAQLEVDVHETYGLLLSDGDIKWSSLSCPLGSKIFGPPTWSVCLETFVFLQSGVRIHQVLAKSNAQQLEWGFGINFNKTLGRIILYIF